MPFAERGRRTDLALRALPDLLAGEPVRFDHLASRPVVQLAPGVAAPRFWIGNNSAVARRRAAQLGDGWFPSLVPVDEVSAGRIHLAELADGYGRPVPTITIGGVSSLGTDSGQVRELAAGIAEGYGMPLERALSLPLCGGVEQAVERLAQYAEAGVSHAVLGVGGPNWRAQVELLAAVRAEL